MPRRRIIDPQFWNDALLGRLPMPVRLFYIGLWNFSDDAGLVTNDPSWLRVSIFPHDARVKPATIEGYLAELERTGSPGRVLRYAVGDREYFLVTRFHDHQSIEKPTSSRLPRPPQDLIDLVSDRARRAIMGRTAKDAKAVSRLPEGPVTYVKTVSRMSRGTKGGSGHASAVVGTPDDDAAVQDGVAGRAQNEAEIPDSSVSSGGGLPDQSGRSRDEEKGREGNRKERARARIGETTEPPIPDVEPRHGDADRSRDRGTRAVPHVSDHMGKALGHLRAAR